MNYRLKSKIKMNKLKLVQIIVKDLDELKILTQEIAESQNDSPIFIDLALNRANLICEEIKLLRKFSENVNSLPQTVDESLEEDEDEVSDLHFADPDLEILDFEQQKTIDEEFVNINNTEELEEEANEKEVTPAAGIEKEDEVEPEVPEMNYTEPEFEISDPEDMDSDELEELDNEEDVVYDSDEEDEEEIDEDDEDSIDNEDELEEDEDLADLNDQALEDDLVDFEEEEPEIDQKIETKTDQLDNPSKTVSQFNELKNDHHSGIREIHIEDLDDEENDPLQFAPADNKISRPVMREIPKPEIPTHENPAPEKQIIGETFSKEKSLNDAMGENKSGESSLGNGPISSLRAAIGLNDRFLFIREIFANNTDKYNMVIDHLDKLETIQQAVEYLKANLSLEKTPTSLKFVELLKRRFSK